MQFFTGVSQKSFTKIPERGRLVRQRRRSEALHTNTLLKRYFNANACNARFALVGGRAVRAPTSVELQPSL